MKKVCGSILALGVFFSSLGFAEEQATVFVHERDNSITITAFSEQNGFPALLVFTQGGKVLSVVSVTENEEAIDIAKGEVFDIKGPAVESELCNLTGKLSLKDNGLTVGLPEVSRSSKVRRCDTYAVQGNYKNRAAQKRTPRFR